MVYSNMKKLLLMTVILYSAKLSAKVDCDTHKLYCKIKTLRPNMSYQKAMKLSNILYKKAKKYKGDANLAIAIGMQETGLKERNRRQNVIQFDKQCLENGQCIESWKIERGVTDICMFQFHVDTIVRHNMDPIRLKNDITYCADWHFRLMKRKKRICKHLGKDSWTCYHSKTKVLRTHYKKLVERYL